MDEYEQNILNQQRAQDSIQDLTSGRREQYNYERWLIDDEVELYRLELALTGKVLKNDGTVSTTKGGYRLMSDEGAKLICWTYLYPVVKNAKLSRFDTDERNRLVLDNMLMLGRLFHDKYDQFKMDYAYVDMVLTELQTFIWSVINRALGGGERERLMTTQKFVSHQTQQNVGMSGDAYGDVNPDYSQKKKKWGLF